VEQNNNNYISQYTVVSERRLLKEDREVAFTTWSGRWFQASTTRFEK